MKTTKTTKYLRHKNLIFRSVYIRKYPPPAHIGDKITLAKKTRNRSQSPPLMAPAPAGAPRGVHPGPPPAPQRWQGAVYRRWQPRGLQTCRSCVSTLFNHFHYRNIYLKIFILTFNIPPEKLYTHILTHILHKSNVCLDLCNNCGWH